MSISPVFIAEPARSTPVYGEFDVVVMGEAAGVAASMALSAGVRGDGIDVPELQRRLADGGTFLGGGAPEAIQ